MKGSVKDQIDILVKLQDIETQRSELKIDLERISKKIDGLDTELLQFEEKTAEDEKRLAELNKSYRSYESDLEVNQTGLEKSQEKLDSVKTNKEYQLILKEIDDLKRKNSHIEDKMIECLNHIDEAEAKRTATRQKYDTLAEKNKHEKEDIHKQIEEGKKILDDLQKDWEAVSQTVDPDLMSHYLELKEKIKGCVIAPVSKAVCDGCHMNIPPQTFNELQRFDSLKYCPFCHRIIYWKN